VSESGTESPPQSPPKRRPRWGLRTLGFLGLALVAIVTSASLGHHTLGTFGSLLFGLIGAAYCSVKGLQGAFDDDAFRLLTGRRRPR
jgi:peptidoglycan/LPS O-acetylase OafA/YrhL